MSTNQPTRNYQQGFPKISLLARQGCLVYDHTKARAIQELLKSTAFQFNWNGFIPSSSQIKACTRENSAAIVMKIWPSLMLKEKKGRAFVYILLKAIRLPQDLSQLRSPFRLGKAFQTHPWMACFNPLAWKTQPFQDTTSLRRNRGAVVLREFAHSEESKGRHSQYSNQHVFHYESLRSTFQISPLIHYNRQQITKSIQARTQKHCLPSTPIPPLPQPLSSFITALLLPWNLLQKRKADFQHSS